MAGRIEFDFQLGEPQVQPATEIDADRPLRVLVLGDFGGRPQAERGPLTSRTLPRLDLDNFEEVLARLTPRVELEIDEGAGPLTLEFRSLDDFHPDRIYARVGLFSDLAQLRSRLQNPATFAEAAAELKAQRASEPATPPAKEDAAPPVPKDGGALLDQILGSQPAAVGTARASGPVQDLIQRVVAPHIVPGPRAEQGQLVAAVDEAISSRMRVILHHPRFQRLEALWRGLEKLVVAAGDEVRVHLLAALGAMAAQAGGPFLAAADPQVLGCRSLVETPDSRDWQVDAEADERWTALRRSPVAASIGLALPRVLVRLPYGPETDEIESFRFLELTDPAGQHESYLWGSPALGCARLLARSFVEQGWSMQPGANLDLENLPAHTYRSEYDEPQLKPCAEVVLTESAAEAILERGLMPVLSYRGRDAARVARIQSIADPPAPLRAAWE